MSDQKLGLTTAQIQKIVGFLLDGKDATVRAAERVVWAAHYTGDDGWEKLKEAIGQLEEIVGRPEKEPF